MAYKHCNDPPPVVRLDLHKNASPGVPLPAPRYYQVLWATNQAALTDPGQRTLSTFATTPSQITQTSERILNVALDGHSWVGFGASRHLYWMAGSGESLDQATWSWTQVGQYVINHDPTIDLRADAAVLRLDKQHRLQEDLRLDGSLSKDPDPGTVLTFEWSLNSAPATASVDLVAAQFVFKLRSSLANTTTPILTALTTGTQVPPAAAGVYEFGLTLTDDDPVSILYGTRGSASTVITVEIAPPFGNLTITDPAGLTVIRTKFDPVPIHWQFDGPAPPLTGTRLDFTLTRPQLTPGPIATLSPPPAPAGEIIWHGFTDRGEVPAQSLADDRRVDIIGELSGQSVRDVTIQSDAAVLDPYLAWVPLVNWAPHRDRTLAALLQRRNHFPINFLRYRWRFQSIWGAVAATVNLDFFGSLISVMPTLAGAPASPEALLEHIRLNIDAFLDQQFGHVEPYDANDVPLWTRGAVGTAMHWDMVLGLNVEDGAVLLTAKDARHWIFTTLTAPGDFEHPVSGHREFGIMPVGSTHWLLYTRGADRPTGWLDTSATLEVLHGGDQIWNSFARFVTAYVNGNNGTASVVSPVKGREDWNLFTAAYGLSRR